MRKTLSTLFAVVLIGGALGVAEAQDRRGDRGRDNDNDDQFRPASAAELTAADRRLNQVYQRRITDARADDRRDRRSRSWYSQETALRESERQWIAFRDAECRYLTQQEAGSRERAGLVRGCLLQQTTERTEDLRDAEMLLSSR